ncbi:P-loop containing nucleoside triphosphate hydrolase protein [Hyaloraphidium curvatum]|nr:P-loop containing nucleoside triphosphate hydrolase protein [Hyaloraphidium curvatum]
MVADARDGTRHVAELERGAARPLGSVTDESDVDAFLAAAALRGEEFAAERRANGPVVASHAPAGGLLLAAQIAASGNPHLLAPADEAAALREHEALRGCLRVPRRPRWDPRTTPEQLARAEKDAFLAWRRGLAELEEDKGLLLTPFERNLDIWRQLWRVVERSDLVVQIVDARNPLLFRSEDLERYVAEFGEPDGPVGVGTGAKRKRNLLVVNKADFLTPAQRREWADYFDARGIRYAWFSAALAKKLQDEEKKRAADEEEGMTAVNGTASDGEHQPNAASPSSDSEGSDSDPSEGDSGDEEADDDERLPVTFEDDRRMYLHAHAVPAAPEADPRTRILSSAELLALLESSCPPSDDPAHKPTVGMVGYPNVGKSSTINVLAGSKRVAVSSTPGKTKHFQTIHLPGTRMTLCDCPGLVFPTFATTKADLVTQGVLPVDQMREHTGPAALLCMRIPRRVLEWTYGLVIRKRGAAEAREGWEEDYCRPEELLQQYAVMRGFARGVQGNPDEHRAARYLLKDYIDGRLLYCMPPPGCGLNGERFNAEIYAGKSLSGRRRRGQEEQDPAASAGAEPAVAGERDFDSDFFRDAGKQGLLPSTLGKFRQADFSRPKFYPSQNVANDDGTASTATGWTFTSSSTRWTKGDPGENGKKHWKGNKREKKRTAWTKVD